MNTNQRERLVRHLSEAELDQAIEDAQSTDEARLVRRLCFIKDLYLGDTRKQAGRRVGSSRSTTRRWAQAWNEGGVERLRPSFGGRPPPKLSPKQFEDLCEYLGDGQPWMPQAIRALIRDHYGVTYHPAHLSRKLREAGMNYAKPRPMDPRRPDDAEEILAERLGQALGEDDNQDEAEPAVLGFFR
ncbi:MULTISPECIES: helix-turn-helix domain-containing protein [Salinibaculum]|uniref:helix-turn-helix domain-containing protein n=1 Tax=Salinibaculum TaxID=2732368 RepID=UPI0030CB03F9